MNSCNLRDDVLITTDAQGNPVWTMPEAWLDGIKHYSRGHLGFNLERYPNAGAIHLHRVESITDDFYDEIEAALQDIAFKAEGRPVSLGEFDEHLESIERPFGTVTFYWRGVVVLVATYNGPRMSFRRLSDRIREFANDTKVVFHVVVDCNTDKDACGSVTMDEKERAALEFSAVSVIDEDWVQRNRFDQAVAIEACGWQGYVVLESSSLTTSDTYPEPHFQCELKVILVGAPNMAVSE